ncbi:hypothetical protein I6I68_12020 [Corynebacterium glucuronolyticum]|uniref:hypothetical protein n=1 Tax=Corynebacterium glucuronolyticum TaxID=39791 RepID=UPI00191F89DC|nr:hypothetical protein [Corynebacterium glucuronolyticum]QQU88279.1 hypothetical protein I6I68_12020 [Corynebacterium glucuronolyticum]
MQYKLQPTVGVFGIVAALVYLFAPALLPKLFDEPYREPVTIGDDIALPDSPSCELDFGMGLLTGYKCGPDFVRSEEIGEVKDPKLAARRMWKAEMLLPTEAEPVTEGNVTMLRDGDTAVLLAPTGDKDGVYTVAIASGILIDPTLNALQAVNV